MHLGPACEAPHGRMRSARKLPWATAPKLSYSKLSIAQEPRVQRASGGASRCLEELPDLVPNAVGFLVSSYMSLCMLVKNLQKQTSKSLAMGERSTMFPPSLQLKRWLSNPPHYEIWEYC